MSSTEDLYFNGINGATGDYLVPPMKPGDISKIARGERLDEKHFNELKWRHEQATGAFFGAKEGVDAKRLEEACWGVIFAHNANPGVREALAELLEHRKKQASQRNEQYYQEYVGLRAYRPGGPNRTIWRVLEWDPVLPTQMQECHITCSSLAILRPSLIASSINSMFSMPLAAFTLTR